MKDESGRHQHRRAYACTHVLSGERDVLLVSRPDEDWCFLCGGFDHEQGPSSFKVVGMEHLIERDGTLRAVLYLQPQEEAERAARGSAWSRSRVP